MSNSSRGRWWAVPLDGDEVLSRQRLLESPAVVDLLLPAKVDVEVAEDPEDLHESPPQVSGATAEILADVADEQDVAPDLVGRQPSRVDLTRREVGQPEQLVILDLEPVASEEVGQLDAACGGNGFDSHDSLL